MGRRLSIRSRLTLWHLGLLALTLIGFSVALYVALSEQLYRSLDQRLALASLTALGTVRLEDDDSDNENPTFRYSPPEDMSARLLGPDGRILQALGLLSNAPVDPAILDQARTANGLLYTIDQGSVPRARAYVRPRLHDGRVEAYVEVAEPLTVTESALSGLALIVLIAVPITLAVAGFGGWFIADRALRPIDAITRQAQRISEQDLHHRLDLNLPDDEVGRLAHTFDAMLGRLDAAFQRQRQFTADASHELRTPLTVMKTNLGV
ncbi:partial Sensor histidine kinase component HK2, partial [Gammaproteobacteria bacterium]